MQLRIVHDAPESLRAGALVVPVFSDGRLEGAAAAADKAVGGALSDALQSGETKGKLGETALIHAKDLPFRRLLAVGLGERAAFEPFMLARYAGAAVRTLGRNGIEEIAIALPGEAKAATVACGAAIAEGAITGTFEMSIYQAKPEKPLAVNAVAFLRGDLDAKAFEEGVARGTIVGEAVNFARRLAVTPSNDMTPTHLANEATGAAKEAGVAIEVHDADWARKEGMGSFLSVAQGSAQPPKFIVMTYKGDPSSKELLALVGKGITFDTGGISIKPAERMEPKLNVIGVVPSSENLPGPRAVKPGDILRAMNGKTIEVINTDAEGRLILADGLCYANKLGATRIVDAATLTGAVVIALGHAASAVVANDDAFVERFLAAAKPTGERYWRMPLYEDYSDQMKSDIADLKNTGGRAGGTLTAAAFLKAFVGDTPWVHLDVAGTAYLDRGFPWSAKGPTGTPVRAFLALIESLSS